MNREGGAQGSGNFWSQSEEHSGWCGHVHYQIIHHEMDKHTERDFKEHSLKPNAGSHNNASWCTDTDGFLEHSPSGGSLYYKGPTLQKIILLLWGGPPLIYML